MGIGKIRVDWGNVREKVQDLAAKQPSTTATILALRDPVVTTMYIAYKAPDLKKGDVKEKLEGFWEEIHPSSKLENEETRGRYRRRVGGAAVGAAGGAIGGIQGGAVGMGVGAALGAGVGAYRAEKGHGQTKDYIVTFGIGLAIGYVWTSLYKGYNEGGLTGLASSAWDLIKTAFGLANSAGALQKPPSEATTEAQGQGAGAQLATNPKTTLPGVEVKKVEPVEAYKAWSAVAIATGAVIVLGAK